MRYLFLVMALAIFSPVVSATTPPAMSPAVAATMHASLTAAQKNTIIQAAMREALIILDNAHLQSTEVGREHMEAALGIALENILTRTDMLSMNDGDAAGAAFKEVTTALAGFAGAALGVDKINGAEGGGLFYEAGYIFSAESTSVELIATTGGLVVALAAGAAVGTVIDHEYSRETGSSIGADIAASVEEKDQADLDAAVQAAHDEAQKRDEERQTGTSEDGTATGTSEDDSNGTSSEENNNTGGTSGTPNPDAETGDSGHLDPKTNPPSIPGVGTSDPNPDADRQGNGIDPATGKPYPVNQPGSGADAPAKTMESSHFMHEDLMNILMRGKPPLILVTPDMLNRLRNIPGSLP